MSKSIHDVRISLGDIVQTARRRGLRSSCETGICVGVLVLLRWLFACGSDFLFSCENRSSLEGVSDVDDVLHDGV